MTPVLLYFEECSLYMQTEESAVTLQTFTLSSIQKYPCIPSLHICHVIYTLDLHALMQDILFNNQSLTHNFLNACKIRQYDIDRCRCMIYIHTHTFSVYLQSRAMKNLQ